ncbi:MAG: glycosyltransferase family 9 protein [Bacteroidia bacterium]
MKVLILRFSSIGDIVLTSPVVRCLKQQLKSSEIHFLTKKPFVSIIEKNPNIDKIFSFEKDVNEVLPELKKENYDWVIDLHHNLRSMQVKHALGKSSKSFNKLNIEKWLLVNLKINRLPKKHIVDRYFETVTHLGVKNDQKGLDFFIDAKNEVDISSLPREFHNGFIAFVIGAKHTTKKLPVEKIISICKKLNHPVILIGGKEDVEVGKEIEARVKNQESRILTTCGNFNLQQSASLIKQAEHVITHDTGMMHIAAAFQKNIISVWGNTVPEFGMYPYMPGKESQIVEVKDLSCRPCSKIGFEKCPKGHFKCMNEIDETAFIT